jgi:WD40 repeat protein
VLFLFAALAFAEPELVLQLGHAGGITDIVYTPDGKRVLTAGTDGRLVIWSSATRKVWRSVDAGVKLNALAVSPDGELVVAGGGAPDDPDFRLRLFDGDGELLGLVPGHSLWMRELAFTPDGSQLLSYAADGELRICPRDGLVDLRAGAVDVTRVVEDSDAERMGLQVGDAIVAVDGVRFPPSLEFGMGPVGLVVERAGREVELEGEKTGERLGFSYRRLPADCRILATVEGFGGQLAVHPGGEQVAYTDGGTVRVLRIDTAELVYEVEIETEFVTAVAWSDDVLVVSGKPGSAVAFAADGSPYNSLDGFEGEVTAIEGLMGAVWLADEGGQLVVWDLHGYGDGPAAFPVDRMEGPIDYLAFAADGMMLTVSYDEGEFGVQRLTRVDMLHGCHR